MDDVGDVRIVGDGNGDDDGCDGVQYLYSRLSALLFFTRFLLAVPVSLDVLVICGICVFCCHIVFSFCTFSPLLCF